MSSRSFASLAERRSRCLRDLNARLGEARTAGEVFAFTVEACAGQALLLCQRLLG